jgi:SAM-dependent methyltransferase
MTSDRPAAAARIISLYEDTAAAWDEIRGRNPSEYEPEYFDRFLAGVRPGGAILDLGCGTGHPVANYLLERGFRVTGVDSAPSLIALARRRLPAGEWLVGDMRTLDLGRRFDGILAWYSFFHLAPDDQRAMFPVFAAHALPGAPLSFPPAHWRERRSASGKASRSITPAWLPRNIALCSRSMALTCSPFTQACHSRPAQASGSPGPVFGKAGPSLTRTACNSGRIGPAA